jgi:hypothetical protein
MDFTEPLGRRTDGAILYKYSWFSLSIVFHILEDFQRIQQHFFIWFPGLWASVDVLKLNVVINVWDWCLCWHHSFLVRRVPCKVGYIRHTLLQWSVHVPLTSVTRAWPIKHSVFWLNFGIMLLAWLSSMWKERFQVDSTKLPRLSVVPQAVTLDKKGCAYG